MKTQTKTKKQGLRQGLCKSVLFLIACFLFFNVQAQQTHLLVDTAVKLIDGLSTTYANVQPGDTIFLKAGNRDKLLIRNFNGTQGHPITFMNKDGIVRVSTDSYYGISIRNCRYIRFSGQGNSPDFYGIQIKKVEGGAGLGIGSLSSDFEIDHVSIENCLTAGIYAKTDPDCSMTISRDSFTQFNTNIHHNYISYTGNEGLYIGSTSYAGVKLTCNGKDTTVFPPILDGVEIYENVVSHTGWDGIQVSSAPLHCRIFNNKVTYDSEAEKPNQMSGIIIGGGSACDCNNNFVSDGKGIGIEDHGLGGRIFNNIIVNAGRTYLPNDLTKMKHGIFISDVSAVNDSSFYVAFNDIINPKSDGIRFQSIKSRQNSIVSNLIINPGNYYLYEHDNTANTGQDAYVMIPDKRANVELNNNFFTENIQDAKISPTNYSILSGSPLINTGSSGIFSVSFDFNDNPRPVGGFYDIGAVEYDGGEDSLLQTLSETPVLFSNPVDSFIETKYLLPENKKTFTNIYKSNEALFPNPANSFIKIRYLSFENKKTLTNIYKSTGALVLQQTDLVLLPGQQELFIDVSKLQPGIYFYAVQDQDKFAGGKFIKL